MSQDWDDIDPTETKEWLDAFNSVVKHEGTDRARFILEKLMQRASHKGVAADTAVTTPYQNTIPANLQPEYPGNLEVEAEIDAIIRWNAIAMVLRAKEKAGGVGGHLSSYASIATLYEVGLNHYFAGATPTSLGDLIYFQGHSSEGNYARAYIEGRLDDEHLGNFRQEIGGKGVSSYPHPWLMPHFWQFATVSLGIGPLQAIYQARFIKYLENRQLLAVNEQRKVWVFCGDGEMDEPDSIAGLSLAAREKLDNMIYVVNCNLQRLDGLVRSNGKIIQELEGIFRGAGWNVIKVLWGSKWDALFAKDKKGILLKRLTQIVDGDFQNANVRGSEYTREFFAGDDEELKALFKEITDDEMDALNRGGHDPIKVNAAYAAAMKHKGQPTVILAQTIKGYGLGTTSAEGRNIAHNHLDMTVDELKAFKARFNFPLSDEKMQAFEFYQPKTDSEAVKYLHAKRHKLGGYIPTREAPSNKLTTPALEAFDQVLKGSGDRTASTTMVLGRILNVLFKDANIAKYIVPIFSDEVRTFGLESLFRQIGIYAPAGQLYTPEDKEQLVYYREAVDGQLLEEGITEAGCMASWMAAATSYSTHRRPMIPFFTYYSMFGFQRVGDFIWAAADIRARGFLIGATAGRTTLEGEGLQHQDGQSLLAASAVPSCRSYDPAFGYELAVIIQHGMKVMFEEEQDVFYYVMAMNEKYVQPAMPEGVADDIVRGIYLLQTAKPAKLHVQLFGSGAILREAIAATELLKNDFKVSANVWSVTSYNELYRDGMNTQRHNMLHPEEDAQAAHITQILKEHTGPVIAASDYVRAYPEQLRQFIPGSYTVLGTDGYGRSDTREKLRQFFEVNRYYIAVAALYALYQQEKVLASTVSAAIKKYNIDITKPNPWNV